jgi:hypothetical protein
MASETTKQPPKSASSATSATGKTKVTARLEGQTLREFVESLPFKPVSMKITLPNR